MKTHKRCVRIIIKILTCLFSLHFFGFRVCFVVHTSGTRMPYDGSGRCDDGLQNREILWGFL